MIETETNLDYLIVFLRMRLGDTKPSTYRYTDPELRTALVTSIMELQRWWNYRYLLDSNYNAYRNSQINDFLFGEPPTIQNVDEAPIEIMASLIIKEGSLENASYSLGAWRDNEISFSNIEFGRSKDASIQRDWNALLTYLTPPSKKLAWPQKGELPGFPKNPYEVDQNL